MSLKQMFLIGVVGPTVVTVIIFIAFLICWFKFNWKEKFFEKFMKPSSSATKRGRISDCKMEPNMLYRNHMEDLEEAGALPPHIHIMRVNAAPPGSRVEDEPNMYEPVEVTVDDDNHHRQHHVCGHYIPVWTNTIAVDTTSQNDDNSSGYMSPVSRSSSEMNDLSMDTSSHHIKLSEQSHCMNLHVDAECHQHEHTTDARPYGSDCISCSQNSQTSSGLDNSMCTEMSIEDEETGGVHYGHVITVIPDNDVDIVKDVTVVKDKPQKTKRVLQYTHNTQYICSDYSDFTKVQMVPNGQVIKGFNV